MAVSYGGCNNNKRISLYISLSSCVSWYVNRKQDWKEKAVFEQHLDALILNERSGRKMEEEMISQKFNRRDFLRVGGVGAAHLLGNRYLKYWKLLSAQAQMGEEFMPDAEVAVTAAEKWVQILPGAQTRVWSYEGQLLSGSGVTVQNLPGNYLGPILRVKSGTKVRIFFHNNLAEDSVIHPHGLRVPEPCDGHPMQAIGPGEIKTYDFEVIDRAGPYWFHPHPHMRTAEQVYMGLAGLFNVWDPEEELAVPGASSGANDLPVIIQDRFFDSNNQFMY